MRPIRVLALTRYGFLGASSRLRSLQYIPVLESAGIEVVWEPLFNDASLNYRYKKGKFTLYSLLVAFSKRIQSLLKISTFDVVWIEKESLPFFPVWIEAAFLSSVPYVLDYDDAVFHNYDENRFALVRWLYGSRLDILMSKASLVMCGNKYLADRAYGSGAQNVELIPTVIDLERYPVTNFSDSTIDVDLLRIVWIGSPTTAQYLEILVKPLQMLSLHLNFIFRVIGAKFNIPGVQVECLPWSESSEVDFIRDCHLGVMPLNDSNWERGKCGYKLIQYMGCSLPVVASPVGLNTEIVANGVNGFLASTEEEWASSLEILLTQGKVRQSMGKFGRAKVEAQYCIQKLGPKVVELLKQVAKTN